MTNLFTPFIPSLPQVIGLFALFALATGMVAVGAAFGGRRRPPEADLIFGWAAITAFFTLAGVIGVFQFTSLTIFVAVLTIAAGVFVLRRDGRLGPAGAIRIILIAAPLLILVSAITPTQWDELTHWLPNARYLLENDTFPRNELPASPSNFPAYPYGVPLVIYFASRITGFFATNAAPLFNTLLFLSFGAFLARMVVASATAGKNAPLTMEAIGGVRMSWSLCALAALIAAALNPTFVPKLVFSSYADGPTTIAIGFAGLLSWLMLNALSEGDEAAAKSFAWQSSLALTAAIGLKQVNLIFLIALVIAIAVIALRDPGIRLRALLKIAPYAFILPLAVYVLWRIYVATHLTGGEFVIRPPSEWLIVAAPEILGRMASVASKKGGYFGIMLIAIPFALRALPSPRTAFDRLTILTATVFLTYNGFLLFSYVAIFGEWEARNAASYWRYNTHLGGICLLFATYSGALLWRRFIARPLPKMAGPIAIILVIAVPFAMGKKFRFDSHPRYDYAYSTAGEIANQLSRDDRLYLIDLKDNGQYLVIMKYKMHGSATVSGDMSAFAQATRQDIRSRLEQTDTSHVWIFENHPEAEAALGTKLKDGASHLLSRSGDAWSVVRSWPHPEGTQGVVPGVRPLSGS